MTNEHLGKFMSQTDQTSGCWLWFGSRLTGGYGRVAMSEWKLAHRVSYEHFIGPIPEGLEIDHICGNRPCVNPLHLDAVTRQSNVDRGNGAIGTKKPGSFGERISVALRGRPKTKEHRAAIGAANALSHVGMKHSDDTKAKMSASRRAYWQRKRAN